MTILIVDLSLLQVSSPVAQHYTILIALVRYNRERHAVHCTVLGQHEHGRAVILLWHVAYLGIGRVTNGTMLVVFVFRTQVELQKIFLEARVIQHHIQR